MKRWGLSRPFFYFGLKETPKHFKAIGEIWRLNLVYVIHRDAINRVWGHMSGWLEISLDFVGFRPIQPSTGGGQGHEDGSKSASHGAVVPGSTQQVQQAVQLRYCKWFLRSMYDAWCIRLQKNVVHICLTVLLVFAVFLFLQTMSTLMAKLLTCTPALGWFSPCCRLLLEAKKKLLEQQELTQQERHLQEERAKDHRHSAWKTETLGAAVLLSMIYGLCWLLSRICKYWQLAARFRKITSSRFNILNISPPPRPATGIKN